MTIKSIITVLNSLTFQKIRLIILHILVNVNYTTVFLLMLIIK
jgi:hypothetical protein